MRLKQSRSMLGRMHRKRAVALTKRRTIAAMNVVDDVLAGLDSISSQRGAYDAARTVAGAMWWKDPQTARALVELMRALFRSRHVSWAHFVFVVGSAVEGVHESLWFDGRYSDELDHLTCEMEALDEQAGPEAAAARIRLNTEYGRVLDRHLDALWTDLGAEEVGDLWRNTREAYDSLRERGRRYVHHRADAKSALRDLVDESYAEAQVAASQGSFRAAVTLLGTSLEGLLLMRCLQSPRRARTVVTLLPRRLRTRAKEDILAWPFEVLIEVCARAQWLPVLLAGPKAYDTRELAHSLRDMRNWIHPGREAVMRPWQGVFKPDYEIAHALYVLVDTSVRIRRKRSGA